jgi:hypothetical protein
LLKKIEDWLNELETYSTNHDIKKILVGNKCDKVNFFQVPLFLKVLDDEKWWVSRLATV